MWKTIFEALEKNAAWRTFRHAKALGDIFNYFGISAWIASVLAVIVGIVMIWIASLPTWGKLLVGLLSILVVLLIALVGSIIVASRRTNESESELEKSAENGGWKRVIFGILTVAALILAAVMSTKPRTTAPTTPPNPQPPQTAQIPSPPPAVPKTAGDKPVQKTAAKIAKLANPADASSTAIVKGSPVNSAPNGIANSGTINGGATVTNTFAEKQRVLADSDVDDIAKAMSPFGGDPLLVYVQSPATKEMRTFSSALLRALGKAQMNPQMGVLNFVGGACQGDGGVTFYGSGKYLADAWALQKALTKAKIIETLYPICLYGNGKDDLQVIVWVTRP